MTRGRPTVHMLRLLTFAAIAGTLAVPAAAEVYEVGDDGVMVQLDKPVARPGVRLKPHSRPSISARAETYRPFIARAGQTYEVSPALIDAIARTESGYNQAARSPVRAAGIMQLMPRTARAMGVDSSDARDNIRGGVAYLRLLLNRFDGDVVRTIAAYNAGPAAVERAGGVPRFPETRAYVAAVLARLADAAVE